jgi:hypothetical protein
MGTAGMVIRAASVAVLVLHALVTALAPAELLLLSDHDHVVLGTVTPEQWAEHLQFHLQQARDYLAGIHVHAPGIDHHTTGAQIISLPWCDMSVQNTQPMSFAILPCAAIQVGAAALHLMVVVPPDSLDLSPSFLTLHRPPRSLAFPV